MVEIVSTVDGRWIVLVNGFQWGPPGSKVDASGAYDATYATEAEALEAWQSYRRRQLTNLA